MRMRIGALAFGVSCLLSTASLAQQVTYATTQADGVGEQLRLELLAIPGIPQVGWNVTQSLKTGTITITYVAASDLTAAQKTSVQTAIANHTPAWDSVGDDHPELLLGKMAYALRHWSSLNATQKERFYRAAAVQAIRSAGRWD